MSASLLPPLAALARTPLAGLIPRQSAEAEAVADASATALAYVTNTNDGTVSVIDTATNTVTATIPVARGTIAVAVTPDGSTAYAVSTGDSLTISGTVSVIDTATDTVTATFSSGNGAARLAFSPDGTAAYVANNEDGTVSVVDTATNTVTATVPVGSGAFGVAVASVPASEATVTVSPNPALVDRPVTLTAEVTCSEGTPTGSVVFYDGAVVLGTRQLTDGTASLVATFDEGNHPITVEYLGDAMCPPATSAPVVLVVDRIPSTTTLGPLPAVTLRFLPVALTAAVTCPDDTPTGTVQFFDGPNLLGTAPVLAGVAFLFTAFRTAGQHTITAAYSGDRHCEPSVSAPVAITVL